MTSAHRDELQGPKSSKITFLGRKVGKTPCEEGKVLMAAMSTLGTYWQAWTEMVMRFGYGTWFRGDMMLVAICWWPLNLL